MTQQQTDYDCDLNLGLIHSLKLRFVLFTELACCM